MIIVSKRDVVWSYLGQFFSIASGLITLPLVLRMLSTEEIGMNYLMLTLGSLVSLFDFGFSPQFGRNISYVFSGVKELRREGVETPKGLLAVDYRLLATMIKTARFVYLRLGLIVLLTMLSFGTAYISHVTHGFINVNNSLLIWILFSFSTFFNVYYSYYTSLLTGKGLIMESKKAMVFSRLMYITLTYLFLLLGWGLLGVTLANLIAPFINRGISYKYFFSDEVKNKINQHTVPKSEVIKLFNIIWHNAQKLGLVFVGSYAISKLSLFLAGLYLSMEEIASYGLMMQLVGLISSVAMTLYFAYQPRFASLRVQNDQRQLVDSFSFTLIVFYFLFIVGGVSLILFGPWLLMIIKSNAMLPSIWILVFYLLITLLENNHSCFATLIVTKNNIPFVIPSLLAGGLIGIGSFISLKFTALGILGLVIVQGFCQLIYNNWKWPLEVLREFNISFPKLVYTGICMVKSKTYSTFYGREIR